MPLISVVRCRALFAGFSACIFEESELNTSELRKLWGSGTGSDTGSGTVPDPVPDPLSRLTSYGGENAVLELCELFRAWDQNARN